jgi:hypothetical protein
VSDQTKPTKCPNCGVAWPFFSDVDRDGRFCISCGQYPEPPAPASPPVGEPAPLTFGVQGRDTPEVRAVIEAAGRMLARGEPAPRCDADLEPKASLTAEPLQFGLSAWPIADVLERLADAADHLRGAHNCDAPGHEGVLYATQAAREHVKILRSAPAPAEHGMEEIERLAEAVGKCSACDGEGVFHMPCPCDACGWGESPCRGPGGSDVTCEECEGEGVHPQASALLDAIRAALTAAASAATKGDAP